MKHHKQSRLSATSTSKEEKPRGMKKLEEAPFSELDRVFHEPNRMAIMAALCFTEEVLSFMRLKEKVPLSFGNMNRHLAMLQKGGFIRQSKSFVNLRPRTTIQLTKKGVDRYGDYLKALDEVASCIRTSVNTKGATIGERQPLETA